jgi:predicted Zn-dependent protease
MSTKSRKEQIEELLAETPDDAFLRYGLAMEYLSAGQFQQAAQTLLALIAQDPGYIPAYYQAGKALLQAGQDPEAQATLQQGIQRARACGETHAAEEMEMLLDSLGG